ncbi:putative scaffolding protein [Dickeya phage BF25/12]|uniref:Putative scaffolding protein n=1 Tax=Dickeya phage BF25/12 TaxID=1698708 RepID=A0A219MH47_9CAUD|nr:head scaffolding protein [Dickeya phage BF25/12]ALA46503.1 putative scaffolding protein [Dickeya phage BF25/12]
MADVELPGALPEVQGGQGAFGDNNPGAKVVPDLPQDKLDPQGSKLDQILELVRQGRAKEAGDVVDAAAQERDIAKAKLEGAAAEDKPDVPELRSTGNKALDIAVSTFVSVTGTSEEDISKAMEAAYEAGDAKYIDKEFLKSRYGDKADQAIALAEAVFEADIQAQQALLNSVYSAAGGKEQFDACSALFKEHAKPAMRAVVKNMLDSGDPEAVREAASLIAEFGKQSGALVEKEGSRQLAAAGVVSGQGLTAQEFHDARHALNPLSKTYHDDMARLMDLRRLGKQTGK